jgi:hypothetical protein
MKAGIAIFDGESRKASQATADSLKSGVTGQQQGQKIIQFMHPGDGKAPLLQKGLEKFLGSLLAVKANFIVRGWTQTGQVSGDAQIAFGLANPRRSELFHTGRRLWP